MDQATPPPPPPPSALCCREDERAAMVPPPPPPLPPPNLFRSSKPVRAVPPPPPAPGPDAFEPIDKAHYHDFLKRTKVNMPSEPFHPFHMFFYGSLMDHEVLQAILGLPEPPITRPATIAGFRVKMWGIYPTLIPYHSGSVTGTVWEIISEAHFDRLAAYETAAYRWDKCDAVLEDGEVLGSCRTFCWAGEPDSKELEDGDFDFERYQKYFKPSAIRCRLPLP